MEPRDRPSQTLSSLTWRFRLAAVSLALVAVAFVQAPGRIVADTKLDLVIDPGGFLGRALTMWDPVGAFGQVQNQAYGYLFPMGPFFLLGKLAAIEPWVIQRLWWSLLLVTAFLGIVKLSGAMGIGAPWARIVAGLAYALSPRMLTVIGPSSIEVWPMALAPWVLVPLVIGMRRHDPRWMAALSALAVACVGGVNAVATFAVIPLGGLWLLLQPASPRRRSLMVWWPLFVLLGTLWWLVPLLMLGAYSPPFLDYIESASTTTFAATLFDALRGTTNWVPYVDANSVAGNDLLRSIGLIVNGAVVVALGIVGIARRGTPQRRFLLGGLLMGLLLVTLGHTGTVHGWGAESVQQALDGVLAPLRNTHKFDLVIRIPLVLGFAHTISRLGSAVRETDSERLLRRGVAVLGVSALLGATVPAWTGALASRGAFESVPGYWQETADWLAQHDSGQRALLVPAASFGDYLWGRTGDDVIQPLADSPWATRNAIPLAPGGNILTLDVIERRLASGHGSAGFADYLEGSGVRYLVVRNDLAATSEHTDPERVYATLAETPGVTSVAQFGPGLGSDPVLTDEDGERVLVKGGWQAIRPAVEVFAVGSSGRGPVSVQDLDETPVVAGGPDSLLALDELGVAPGAAILADDVVDRDERPGRVVLTDGDRRREAAFGRAEQNRSGSLADDEPYSLDRPVHDYRVSPTSDFQSSPQMVGAAGIEASSSQSDAGSPGPAVPGAQPWSAFDGDPRTQWKAGGADVDTSWIELRLGGPTEVDEITITLAPTMERTRTLTVTTDAGSVEAVAQPGLPTTVDLPPGATDSIRISAAASAFDPITITDVVVPGLDLSRPLVMPQLPSSWGAPDDIVMTVDQGYRSGCLDVAGTLRCVAGQEQWGEDGRTIDRELTMSSSATYTPSLAVAPIGGAALDAAVQVGRLAAVAASSYLVEDPRDSAVRAIDGDPSTGWIAADDDADPTLTLAWLGDRQIRSLSVETDEDLGASPPTSATLRFDDGTVREVELEDGVARFAPVRASSVEVHLDSDETRSGIDAFGTTSPLPVGVSEIDVRGPRRLFPQPPSDAAVRGRCGDGPAVEIDGRRYRTRVTASEQSLLAAEQVQAQICGLPEVTLDEGTHRIQVVGNDVYRPVSFVLGAPEPEAVDAPTVATTPRWGKTERTVDLDGAQSGDRLVTVAENGNAGWRDVAGSTSVQVNGWQQGYVVPAAADELRLEFAPAARYRWALLVGALAFVALLGMTLLRRRVRQPAEREREFRGSLLVLGLTFAVSGLLAGTVGLGIAALGWVTGLVVRRFSAEAAAWLTAVPVVVAAGAYAVLPWGSDDGWAGDLAWAQLVLALSLGMLAASVVGGVRLRPRLRRRIEGSSTTR
ncbi:alpha-(1-_3)-arabinofuranosyltransferase domain-containing protein [Mumia qirimensis]|uniref:alpha-(1->3)-arabinofuranosyltransferase domain-containing protein n=1 Tax=Mumia qirimensis TaxID=3234852 RepID=UPI00351D1021